jgi:hypothetical protein
MADLVQNTPGDGVVTGFGTIKDGETEVRCALIACECQFLLKRTCVAFGRTDFFRVWQTITLFWQELRAI